MMLRTHLPGFEIAYAGFTSEKCFDHVEGTDFVTVDLADSDDSGDEDEEVASDATADSAADALRMEKIPQFSHVYACVSCMRLPNPIIQNTDNVTTMQEDLDACKHLIFKLLIPSHVVGV